MGGGFLLWYVRRYSGPEGGVETVFVAVLVVVDFVACFGLFMFKLHQFVLMFHCFLSYKFGIWILVGRIFWIGYGVCSGGS